MDNECRSKASREQQRPRQSKRSDKSLEQIAFAEHWVRTKLWLGVDRLAWTVNMQKRLSNRGRGN